MLRKLSRSTPSNSVTSKRDSLSAERYCHTPIICLHGNKLSKQTTRAITDGEYIILVYDNDMSSAMRVSLDRLLRSNLVILSMQIPNMTGPCKDT